MYEINRKSVNLFYIFMLIYEIHKFFGDYEIVYVAKSLNVICFVQK